MGPLIPPYSLPSTPTAHQAAWRRLVVAQRRPSTGRLAALLPTPASHGYWISLLAARLPRVRRPIGSCGRYGAARRERGRSAEQRAGVEALHRRVHDDAARTRR